MLIEAQLIYVRPPSRKYVCHLISASYDFYNPVRVIVLGAREAFSNWPSPSCRFDDR